MNVYAGCMWVMQLCVCGQLYSLTADVASLKACGLNMNLLNVYFSHG